MVKRFFFIFVLLILITSCKENEADSDNYVVLVSFDGFRWDYPDIYSTPSLDAMEENGVKAERVIPSFPTKTFPNHYSIATGLYPDHHGLISNSFYAPDLGLLYRIRDREAVQNGAFYGGEPIWNTAEKQGLKTASFFWVGSSADVQGMHPSSWKVYDGELSFESRVDTAIHWLALPEEERPRLILLYFQEPDGVGHRNGPVHEEVEKTVLHLDNVLGLLRERLAELPHGDKVNLIVTSDHGMGAVSADRYVNLNNCIEESWLEGEGFVGGNPMYLLDVAREFVDSVVFRTNEIEGVTAWRKEDIPAALNYGTNERIPDLVVVADSSWAIGLADELPAYAAGTHGYDNRNMDMHNIFYAEGPDFKQGEQFGVFENVDIYSLIAEILKLNPAPTDGKLENVEGMLK